MIEKIIAPSEVPISIDDWQHLIEIQAALLLAVQGAERIVGSNVVRGAVFLVGGATYLATADTAITGTASDYVKLTVSLDGLTLTPSYVADLTGVTWDSANNGYYDVDGNLYVLPWKEASHGKKIFTESGEWVVPVGVSTVWITGCGRGGNGGGGGDGYGVLPNRYGGGGGGGGGGGAIVICKKLTLAESPGDIIDITISTTSGVSSYFGTTEIKSGATGIGGISATSGGNGSGGAGGGGAAGGGSIVPGKNGSIGSGGAQSGGTGGVGGNDNSFGLYGNGGQGGNGINGSAGGNAAGYAAGGGGGAGGSGDGKIGGAGGAGGPSFIMVEW